MINWGLGDVKVVKKKLNLPFILELLYHLKRL